MSRRLLSFFLCLCICLPLSPSLFAAEDTHLVFRSHSYTPSQGLQYTVNTIDHSSAGREEEHILRYTKNSSLLPFVYSSAHLYNGTVTMTTALQDIKAKGYDPVAAVNGDFFNTSDGTPISLLIQNGVLKSYNNFCSSLGFLSDGTPLIGSPTVSISVTAGDGSSVTVDSLNKVRHPDRVHLYTRDFSETTRTNLNGRHVVLSVSGNLRLGKPVTGTVKQVITGSAAYTLGANEMVLSASTDSAISRFSFLKEGMAITLSAQSSLPQWDEVVTAIGGLKYLVVNGTVQLTGEKARAPRTSVGLTAGGELVVYTVDGRQAGYSNGLTNDEQAARMLELGCVTAIELDGGGSTAMGLRMPGETDFQIVNKPSDQTLRKCSNFLFFCNTSPKLTTVDLLFPSPSYVTMLSNSIFTFDFLAADANYHSLPAPLDGYSGTVSGDANGFVVNKSFAAISPGNATVSFQNGNAQGTAYVHVTDKLDSLTLLDRENGTVVTQLVIAASRSFAFNARGTFNLLPVVSDPESYVWEIEGDIGFFLEPGLFCATDTAGAQGFISVSGGGLSVKIPVTVGYAPQLLSNFEEDLGILEEGNLLFRSSLSSDPCITGFRSAKLSYQFIGDSTTELSLPMKLTLNSWPSMFSMLIRGDGSGNILSLRVTAYDGTVSDLPLCVLDFTDTRLVSVLLPDRCVSLNALFLNSGGFSSGGNFYIDELTLSWEDLSLMSPPAALIGEPYDLFDFLLIPLSVQSESGHMPSSVRLYWDGELMEEPPWDEHGEGTFMTLPPDNGLHVLTLEVTDLFGRRVRSRLELDFGLERKTAIADLSEHWSKPYVYFLWERGKIEIETEFGSGNFDPDSPATRMDIFDMLYRIVCSDDSLYTETVLPFTDLDTIEEKYLPALRALYALGFLAGKADGQGGAYVDAFSPITRADLCVLLARTRAKGYETGSFDEFLDTDSIPPYAVESMRFMIDLQVIQGYNQLLRPTDSISRAESATVLCRLFY